MMLWWMLAGLADQWPQGPGVAPALPLLEEARIYPAIKAVAEGDEITPTRTLVPRVGYPPSLAIAARDSSPCSTSGTTSASFTSSTYGAPFRPLSAARKA